MSVLRYFRKGLGCIGEGLATFNIFPPTDFSYDLGKYKNRLERADDNSVPMEWKSMVIAPMDGTEILLCVYVDEQELPYVGSYEAMRNKWIIYCYPTGEKVVSEKRLLGWYPIPPTHK